MIGPKLNASDIKQVVEMGILIVQFVILSILISPFSFLMLLSKETKRIFFIWFKCFLCGLLIQVVNKILLFIIIVSKDNKEMFSAILIGILFVMYKINRSFLYAKDK